MSQRQHPNPAEGALGAAQRAGSGVADAGQHDDRLAGQQRALLVEQPLLGAEGHTRRQPSVIGGLFQFEGVLSREGVGDLSVFRRHIQEPTPSAAIGSGPANLFVTMQLHSVSDLDPVMNRLSTTYPDVDVLDTRVVQRSVKSWGRLLGPGGRVREVVPVDR